MTIVLQNPSPENEATYLEKLYPHLTLRGLPEYAIPRLIRFSIEINTGATFKHAKEVLKARSWNPDQAADHLYWFDGKIFRKLDQEAWNGIARARAKL